MLCYFANSSNTFPMWLKGVPELLLKITWFANGYGFIQSLLCKLSNPFNILMFWRPIKHSQVVIPMIPVIVNTNINVDFITFIQGSERRNSMNDAFVYWNTDRFGKIHESNWSGVCALADCYVKYMPVYLLLCKWLAFVPLLHNELLCWIKNVTCDFGRFSKFSIY
jgi:hypothetical protein